VPSSAQVGQPGQADRQPDVGGGRGEFVQQFWLRRDRILRTPRVTTLLPQLAATSPATYKKWLDEDVVYIVSDEERAAFRRLATDEEREKFVEQFWLRRDPTPGTAENEFKQEHYRRIAYANEHFTASVPGWRTDRGRIYIQYGPPDEIEAHAGGFYPRPAAQGGGVTGTFPFVQWRYRYIEGIGNIVILEFVDRSGEGEYMMTVGPRDKDNLLQPPGAPVR
jgi:GWxTD domain-containing protein